MARSKKKIPFIRFEIFKKKLGKRNSITCFNRKSLIPLCLLNKKIFIYNGKKFPVVTITKNHIGFKLGEFSFTRRTNIKKK
jgi:ribosomal protein S19